MIATGYSTRTDPLEASAELVSALATSQPRLVLYFASPAYDPARLADAMAAGFPDAELVGCTTAGEIAGGRMLKQSVVAMGIPAEVVSDVKVEVIEDLTDAAGVTEALHSFERHFGAPLADLDVSTHVGLVLIDGLSLAEEALLEKISDLTNLTFIGGSAGDDLAFSTTHVFANGQAHANAAVLALLRAPRGFATIKTQSFHPTPRRLTATRVDEAARTVLEFDGRPAATAYAAACETAVADLGQEFTRSPLGLMVGDEPYVRSPQQVKGQDIVFYCAIKEGMELAVLAADDLVTDTQASVQATVAQLGGISGLVNFHCILRTLELEADHRTEDYGRVFADLPAIGFSTYGEAFIGHVNQTSTMLVLK